MKTLWSLILLLSFQINYAQSEKSLDDTKAYIVKMINQYGWKEHSNEHRVYAAFDGDLLKIAIEGNLKISETEKTYNFANVYRFKGPIQKPGDVAHIIIWVDCLANKKSGKWKKDDLNFDVHSYEAAEQILKAFQHLNKLLKENKPEVEKF